MKTIKMILFAIFVLLITDRVAGLAFTFGLGHETYTITRAFGAIMGTVIAIWGLVQD